MIKLLVFLWLFDTSQPAQSILTTQAPHADFSAPADVTKGFTVKFTVELKKFDDVKTILEIPNVLGVRLRQHDPSDRSRQNYPAFNMPDGSVPVLEANVMLHSVEHPNWNDMTIGIPLAMLKKPDGRHEVVLNFTGIRWTMYVDGELLDNDFPFGYPQWAKKNAWKLDPEYVQEAAIYLPAIEPEKKRVETPSSWPGVQYWTPPGHNTWVGDVVTFVHKGRYHVFYLRDRRHHASKFGCGAHYFGHLSTKDFKSWIEHEAATPLEEQWECIGTGTPFVFDGKLCLSYGLHTTRVYGREKTTLPAQWEYLMGNGRTGEFNRATTPLVPVGATYAVSADGVSNFQKSWIMFHPCENPSVYISPSGELQMIANYGSKGIWESESLDSGWHCINPGFPPGGDCTFFFRWGNFDYIIGGFTGFWSKAADAPNSAYESLVHKGLDFYDGSNVPAITEIPEGRFLMASWIPIRGWGGTLVIRELTQLPDGIIGSRWMRELTPATEEPKTLAASVSETMTFPVNNKAFMLVFDVQPLETRKGKLAISFLPDNGQQSSCELQIRPDDRRAQFSNGSLTTFASQEKTLREGGAPQTAGNYAIENLIGVDKPFAVRVIVKGDEKLGGSLVDAEIAGQRTMISYRPDLLVKTMVFRAEGVELRSVQIAPLKQ